MDRLAVRFQPGGSFLVAAIRRLSARALIFRRMPSNCRLSSAHRDSITLCANVTVPLAFKFLWQLAVSRFSRLAPFNEFDRSRAQFLRQGFQHQSQFIRPNPGQHFCCVITGSTSSTAAVGIIS